MKHNATYAFCMAQLAIVQTAHGATNNIMYIV